MRRPPSTLLANWRRAFAKWLAAEQAKQLRALQSTDPAEWTRAGGALVALRRAEITTASRDVTSIVDALARYVAARERRRTAMASESRTFARERQRGQFRVWATLARMVDGRIKRAGKRRRTIGARKARGECHG